MTTHQPLPILPSSPFPPAIPPSFLPYLRHASANPSLLPSLQRSSLKSYLALKHTSTLIPESLLDSTGVPVYGFDEFLDWFFRAGGGEVGHAGKEEDLIWPLTSYFINSSHNTYLTGNQVWSDSSTEAYTNVLLRGCRCIEIDVWNGEVKRSKSDVHLKGDAEKKHRFHPHMPHSLNRHIHKKDDSIPAPANDVDVETLSMPKPWVSASTAMPAEPRVLHGYTLTKEVPFRDVCAAIRDAAFIASDLPVIVSLELHVSAEQQEIMVEIIKETWKGLLVDVPRGECISLPSPAELRRKILVKVKYSAPKDTQENAIHLVRSASSSSNSDNQDIVLNTKEKKTKTAIISSLSELGVYTRSYHFKSLAAPEATVPTHVFALSEKKLMEIHQSHGRTLFSHNQHFFMRAYPSGSRLSSSNLDPAVFWRKGVQMVALNWQRLDEGTMLNEAMFAGTGGWVLKPLGYRGSCRNVVEISHESQADAIEHKTLSLSIEVCAALGIPLPPGDKKSAGFHPYIKFELHTESSEERSGQPIRQGGKTKEGQFKRITKPSRGNDPDFGSEVLNFTRISNVVEALSFVRLKILDDELGKDHLAAWSSIRLDQLHTGLRLLPLLDAKRVRVGMLLVKVEKLLS